jgi:hypothetical protein
MIVTFLQSCHNILRFSHLEGYLTIEHIFIELSRQAVKVRTHP